MAQLIISKKSLVIATLRSRNIVRHSITSTNQKVPTVANPVTFSGYEIQYNRAPPMLSEHTNEILQDDLGYSDCDIEKLRAKNII